MSDSQSVPNLSIRITKLSLATVLTMALLGPSIARAETMTVRVINRSISLINAVILDENASKKILYKNEKMGAGAEASFEATVKAPPGGGKASTHVSWKIIALNDQGFPFKPNAKKPVRCGEIKTTEKNVKLEIGPYNFNKVNGHDC